MLRQILQQFYVDMDQKNEQKTNHTMHQCPVQDLRFRWITSTMLQVNTNIRNR